MRNKYIIEYDSGNDKEPDSVIVHVDGECISARIIEKVDDKEDSNE